MSEWIEIKEGCKMPQRGTYCLIWIEAPYMDGKRVSLEALYSLKGVFRNDSADVTYNAKGWQPLPTPPESA